MDIINIELLSTRGAEYMERRKMEITQCRKNLAVKELEEKEGSRKVVFCLFVLIWEEF